MHEPQTDGSNENDRQLHSADYAKFYQSVPRLLDCDVFVQDGEQPVQRHTDSSEVHVNSLHRAV
ncbi:hypothetical protein D3C71_1965070 [compost metagenome]